VTSPQASSPDMSGFSPTAPTVGAVWRHAVRVASALAAAMGVGRFVYTPILPMMTAQAGLSPAAGAALATMNYLGYLLGALTPMLRPALVRSRVVYRSALLLLIASLALMPCTHNFVMWSTLRLVAGFASAMVFIYAVSSLLSHLHGHPAHLPGWGFSGVGTGIALAGVLVLVINSFGDWRTAWWSAAGLCAGLAAGAWALHPERGAEAARNHSDSGMHAAGRPLLLPFVRLLASYTLEGIGYIVAGTFLVAAVSQTTTGWVGATAWVLVGVAAMPSTVLWAWLDRHFRRPDLLLAALLLQAVGIGLPVLAGGGAVVALVAALLFGATFMGISALALAAGAHVQVPRAVSLLTVGYSLGQIAGPLAVTPLIKHDYHAALAVAALVVLAAAGVAFWARGGFPANPRASTAGVEIAEAASP
jgi:predicted MFS family arabinose efflux permease